MTEAQQKLSTFPAFFRVGGRTVVIVGAGDEAFAKARLLFNTDARIVVVAEEPQADFARFIADKGLALMRAPFSGQAIAGATLVFAATGDAGADRAISAAARALRIPVNAVDQPDHCDFFTPALVSRAPVAVAIGTEGAGPVLAQMIRAEVDRILSPSLGRLASLAESYREAVDRVLPRGVTRRVFWRRFFRGAVADAVNNGDIELARRAANTLLNSQGRVAGHVWLVGAGPGAEDLLTLRAQRVMMEADAIVFDPLVPQAIVDMGRRDAERLSRPQDEAGELLVSLGRAGKRVVRLNAGDPLAHGRAGGEIAALRQAGIACEVVPGVSGTGFEHAEPVALRGPVRVTAALGA